MRRFKYTYTHTHRRTFLTEVAVVVDTFFDKNESRNFCSVVTFWVNGFSKDMRPLALQ